VTGFGLASLGCALAPEIGYLVAARAVQGLAAALMMPSALAIILNTFPPAERGGAIGTWTAWSAGGAVLGPLVGGGLLEIASWRWIFLVNVPFVIALVSLILIAVPRAAPRGPDARRVDIAGALLCVVGLAGIVFALVEQPRLGWGDPGVFLPLAGGALAFAAFLFYESRAQAPMLPLGLFRLRNFTAGNIETFAVYAGLAILFFFLVLFLQQIGGYTPIQSGLAVLPVTLVLIALSRRFGALAMRVGPRLLMGVGPLVSAGGLLLLQRVDLDVDYFLDVLPGLLLFAVGLAMTVAPLTFAVLAGAEAQAGIASGVNNAVARVSGLVGIAGLGAVVAGAFGSRLDELLRGTTLGAGAREELRLAKELPLGTPDVHALPAAQGRALTHAAEQASLHSFHVGMAIAAGLVAIGGIAGLVGIRNPRPPAGPPPSPPAAPPREEAASAEPAASAS